MIRTTIRISGMMCGMCEAHIAETIRKAYPNAKKLSVSRSKGTACFITAVAPDKKELREMITATGYTFISADTEEYVQKGFFDRILNR